MLRLIGNEARLVVVGDVPDCSGSLPLAVGPEHIQHVTIIAANNLESKLLAQCLICGGVSATLPSLLRDADRTMIMIGNVTLHRSDSVI